MQGIPRVVILLAGVLRFAGGGIGATALAESTTAVALDTTEGWSRGLAGDTVHVRARVSLAAGEGGRLSVGWASSMGSMAAYPLPAGAAADSVRFDVPVVLPYAEEGDSLIVEVRVDSSGDELPARTAVRIGPTTAGSAFLAPMGAGTARDLRLRGTTLVLLGVGAFRTWDLDTGTEVGGSTRLGADASPGDGFVLFEREGRIHRLDLTTGDARLVSDPGFPSFDPVAGDSFSLWFRSCCGMSGELYVLPGRGEALAFPLELPAAGPPALWGCHAVWLETDGESWVIWSADLDAGRKVLVTASADSLLPPSVGPGGIVYAGRLGSRWAAFVHGFDGSPLDTIAAPSGDVRDPQFGRGFLVWREGRSGAWDLRGRSMPEGRPFPVCLAPGDQGPFAVDDSVVLWIDERSEEPTIRGLRVRVPARTPPAARLRFHAVRLLADRVVIEWSLEGEIAGGSFTARRSSTDEGGTEVEVARGDIAGPGYYFCEDRSLPREGGRQRVRYFISIDIPSGSLRFGPVAVVLPERLSRFSLEPESANPAVGEVRFALEVPAGPDCGEAGLDVFDCSGRRVRSVDSGRAVPGRMRLTWDRRDGGGREVAPGVYIVRFRVGSAFSETKKVVLLSPG